MLNLVCYVSLCESLRAGAGSLSYIVHVDCCGLSTIVIKKIIIIIIIIINRFSKLFHCQNQEKICINTISKDLTTPQVCRHTILWSVSVLKATIENKTTSIVAFKKDTDILQGSVATQSM